MILENSVNATLITGTADNDSIVNFGDDVTIDSRAGNDTIYSGLDDRKADRVSINAGAGDNVVSIQGGSDSVTIRTGDGNNLIGSTSPNNAVYSGAGNDSVVFYTGADNNTMETGDGDDVIDAVGHNVTIDAGAGNDRIRTYRNAYDITIKAGKGDDSITLGGPVEEDHTNVVQYADGDGNDTIAALTETDTLQITSGNISGASLVGNNVDISVGSGIITLVEANNININILDADGNLMQTIFSGGSSDDTVVNDTLIVGTNGDDSLINDKGKNVTIQALAGNDTIDNTGDNSIIDAGTGNDIVSVAGASFVTVRTGEGDNTVYSDSNGASEVIYFGDGKNTLVASNRNSTIIGGGGGNVVTLHNGSFGSYVESGSGNDTIAVGHYDITVDAGAGNDLINLYRDAENALIKMGEGNDTVMIYNNTHAQTFQYSGGNDLIRGFDANDTLQIVGHAVSSSIISDGNLILGLGDGSLTLAGVSSAESLNVEYVSKWSTLDGGGWEYYSVVQRDLLGNKRPDKAAQFSISGGNLKDENEDGVPDNVSIGSVIYVHQSGVHTNVNHLSGNVIYNGDALGIEGDDDYNIEAISPIDTSEKFPYSTYITDPNVTAIRGVSSGATISPRGTAGTETAADWISIDSTDSKVTFMDGAYCVYTENKFSTRDYTKLSIANSNNGVEVSTADDLIQTISNLADGYEITVESGINVGEKINFETSGNGIIVVKTTANTGKYSLDADSDEWQYQRFSINGGGDDFTFVFGENGSVVGMEDFDGMLKTDDTSLLKGEWVTLSSGKFQYTGNAVNNPSKYASFVISGESITSTDNLSVKRITYMPAQDACRVELEGINGNATVDDVDLGISGDSLYTAHFTKINDQVLESTIVLMNVSDGATVESNYTAGVDSDGLITFSDGKHSVLTSDNPRGVVTSLEAQNAGSGFELNVADDIFGTIGGLNDGFAMSINAGDNIGDELTFQTDGGNGTITIADETLMAGGENDFTVEFDDDGKVIYSKWATIDGGFVYSGHTTNNYAKTADVSLVGADLKDTNGDGAPDNVNVKVFKSNVLGVAAVMTGLSGEITLNNEPVGVIGDDNYEDHFTAKVRDGAPDSIVAFSKIRELRGISDGATVNATANDMIAFDENAKVHFGDVENVSLNNKNWVNGSAHAQIGIANNDAGADLNIEDGILTEVSGLENGYSISLVSSDNVSNELTFQTDGGAGEIVIGGETLSISGENNFTLELDEDGKAIMGSWSTIDGGFVYSGHATNNYAKTADVSLIGSDLKDTDGDGAPDNVSVNSFTYSNVTGVMAFMSGFSGEVTLNNKDVGVSGDDDYEIHFTAKVIDNASAAVKAYAETKEVLGISTGATVNPNANDIIGFYENTKAHVGDVTKVFIYNKNHKAGGSAHAQIGIDNNGAGADLTIEDDILTEISGLESGYSISLVSSDNVSDELIFQTDGGNGTIIAGDVTLTADGDKDFAIKLDDDGNIAGLKNFSGAATLLGNETFDRDIAHALQQGFISLETDESNSVATLTNGVNDSLNVYYTNKTTGGVIDQSNKTLTNAVLFGQGNSVTLIGSKGDDQLIGNAATVIQTGNAGNDTFRGGVNLEDVLITDYTEGEDVIYHGRPFADLSINGSIEGSDYVFRVGTKTITVQDGADKVIEVVNVEGETRFFGKYLTLDDNDPATVTAQSGVATIDATNRTEDIHVIGNSDDNTILGGGSNSTFEGGAGDDLIISQAAVNSTMTGGKGNDTFRGGASLESVLVTDYTEGEDVVYHGRPFADLSINGSIEGNDYVFYVGTKTIAVQNGANKIIEVVDANGEHRFFGKYLTLDDNDPATVTAQSSVATIDATNRTEDIHIIGNSDDNTILGGGSNSTFEGGAGDDLIISQAAVNSTMTGGKGNDTFRGGASLESVLITDYTEGEDVIYHGRPFEDLSINGSIEGNDYVFYVGTKTITVQNGANKIIEVVDANGEHRFFGKYLTLDDNDPATVTAQSGVATIDATKRTEDIVINGNDGDNTIISSSGDCTLYGGGGKNTFVRGSRTAEQIITVADYTEGEDEVYHSRPFSAFSLLSVAKSVGDDYIFGSDTAMSRYIDGADKKIKFVDVNGDVAYFGNYITILNVDANIIEATEKVKVLDATARTKAVNISGNALDNTIYGGTGNDTLTGGDGSDLFVYSAGNDIVTDYNEDDKISLGAAVSSSYISGAEAILTTDAGTLTIQDAKGKTLNLIDSSGKEYSIKASGATQIISEVTAQTSNVESVAAGATGTRDITLSNGKAAIIAETSAEVNITASTGKDTIISQGENVHVSLTGGNTRIFPLEGRMTVENYDAATGAGFGTTYTNIFTPIADGSIDFNNGYLNLDSAQVYMGKSSELMNFYNIDGKQQKVGYASGSDSLDASNEIKNLLLVAKPDGTITGGSGNDTILANEDSFVDGGAGSNLVRTDGGANIVFSGRTTVENFHTGFGDGSDTIYIAGDPASVEFKADGLTFNGADGNLLLPNVTTTAKVNVYNKRRNVLNKDIFIAQNEWCEVSNSDLSVGTGEEVYFVGTSATPNQGVDFSGVTNDLNVTLDTNYAADTTFWVNNIHSIKGGAGLTSITGSDQNDTILAGSGEQSISGGAGQDKLYGNTDADKNVATFFYTAGDGRDSIENFDFMSNAQDTTADKVKFDDNSAITDVFLRGNDVGIRVNGAKEFVMLEGAQGKSFRLNDDLIAKVDTNAEFDGYSNFYVGIGSKATLTVGKGAGDVEVWLSDDSLDYHGTRYDGNFAILDASKADGNNILAGNGLSNVITGGSGNNSVWGGYGSESDTLIGGAGQNTFFYGAGNGNDNIQNAHNGDLISLEDITLDQIADANITAGGVIFKFTDGGSLTVDGTADVTYQLADGSKYSANHSTHDWDSK